MTHSHLLLHVLVRWLDFIALVTLVGGLSYRQFVLIPVQRGFPNDADRFLRRLVILALLALSATNIADLVFRALMMSGQPLSELFSVLPMVLLKTHFGSVWTWRAGMLMLLLFRLWFLERKQKPWTTGPMILSTGAGVCLTASLSGHAADLGNLTLTVFSDWIHVMAISSWVGGLFALSLHLPRQLALLGGDVRRDYLIAGIRRFSTVAVTAVCALTATGLYNTWVHVHSPALLVGTSYGKILIVKWSLLLPMLVLGAVNRYGILPQLQAHTGEINSGFLTRIMIGWLKSPAHLSCSQTPGRTPLDLERWFLGLVLIEAILGLGVLACSAWMTQLPPPHQISAVMEHSHLP